MGYKGFIVKIMLTNKIHNTLWSSERKGHKTLFTQNQSYTVIAKFPLKHVKPFQRMFYPLIAKSSIICNVRACYNKEGFVKDQEELVTDAILNFHCNLNSRDTVECTLNNPDIASQHIKKSRHWIMTHHTTLTMHHNTSNSPNIATWHIKSPDIISLYTEQPWHCITSH